MNLEKEVGYKEILNDRNFIKYLLGQIISRFGDSIDFVAYGWMVFEITGKTSLMALIFGVNAIPTILLQPIAGVFVEYKKKKNVIFICNFGRAIIVTITAIMFFTGIIRVYHLFVFTLINSTFEAFQTPASTASLPLVLEKEKYAYGMSLRATLSSVMELLGLAAAGGIIALIGISGAMFINAMSFYICGILMVIVKYKDEVLKKQVLNLSAYYNDLKEGFKYMKNTKIVLEVCLFGAIFSMLILPINTLGVAYVSKDLLLGTQAVAVLNFSITAGMLIGSMIYPKLKGKFKGINIFVISGIIFGVSYLSLGFIPFIKNTSIVYIMLGLLPFIFGVSANAMLMVINVAFMEKTDKEYLGRVSGVFNSLVMTSTPVGAVIVAGLCTFLSTSQLFLLFGVGVIILFITQKYNENLQEI